MSRFRFIIFMITLIFASQMSLSAQVETRSAQGSPPIASLISISEPDQSGIVTIRGEVGAVFPGAQVAIRNLFTGQTVYVPGGITGAFTAQLYGPANTPFWITAAAAIPNELRNNVGSMPGGPGTIIYGNDTPRVVTSDQITQLIVDGDLSDWSTGYAEDEVDAGIYALRNTDALYFSLEDELLLGDDYSQTVLTLLTNDGANYTVTLSKRDTTQFNASQIVPVLRGRGAFFANIVHTENRLEARLPITFIDSPVELVALRSVQLLDDEGNELAFREIETVLTAYEENDGVVYPGGRLATDDQSNFYIAGPLAGTSYWSALGRVSDTDFSPGDTLTLELDVTFNTPALPATVDNLTFVGELRLQPLQSATRYANNGWSNVLTRSGLAIDNLDGDVFLSTVTVNWNTVKRYRDKLVFGMRFEATLPDNLPDGLYKPRFDGYVQQPGRNLVTWQDAAFLANPDAQLVPTNIPFARLPIMLTVGETQDTRLNWVLLVDNPSQGSRGILPEEDRQQVGLSNRVRFNSPTYILPAGNYALEPYLPNIMPNDYLKNLPPLISFRFPSGNLTVRVNRPDGITDTFNNMPILQNRLSTVEADESVLFGKQAPVDMYRLTTLESKLTAYNFDVPGEYTITMTGEIRDEWGNAYTGGGTYRVVIAKPIVIYPGVLPGTPFEVDDTVYTGLRVVPALPVDVTLIATHYPVDSNEPQVTTISGQANSQGYFMPDEQLLIEQAGEYIIDYEVRYEVPEGELWAGSMRTAGVIANSDSAYIAHGRRGLSQFVPATIETRSAWYNTEVYPHFAELTQKILYYPYFSSDVIFYEDDDTVGIDPLVQLQEIAGNYANWLLGTVPDYISPTGQTIVEAIRQQSLPLNLIVGGLNQFGVALNPNLIVNEAYNYVSAVRPGVTVRQFVRGDDAAILPTYWTANDPANRQIGAGNRGERPGDYTFLFGGAVLRNAEANVNDTAIYAAVASTIAPDSDIRGNRVTSPYRGQTGTEDSGILLSTRNINYTAFFALTGVQPGQVLYTGESLVIAGQAAPTLRTLVTVEIMRPDGQVIRFSDTTNSIGYFYSPDNNITLDMPGRWTVKITTLPDDLTSAGRIEPPLPVGSVPGTVEQQFTVYAVEEDAPHLDWSRGGNIDTSTPAASPINFSVFVPDGWTEVRAHYTTTTPGYVIDDGFLRNTRPITYQYNPFLLSETATHLESNGRGDDAYASDVVTITIAIEGIDADEQPQINTRTFHVLHNRIVSFEEE